MEVPNEQMLYGQSFGTEMGTVRWDVVARGLGCEGLYAESLAEVDFFFSSRRRHTRSLCDWSSDGALPISDAGGQQGVADRDRGLISDREVASARRPVRVARRAGLNRRCDAENCERPATCRHGHVELEPRSEERRVGKEGRAVAGAGRQIHT